jgi:predicted HNH restriction endonuclease
MTICPDSTKLKGKIYHGIAGYGPFYQIRMKGFARDSLYKIEKKQNLRVQIQKLKTNIIIFLTLDTSQKHTGYTSIYNEVEKALTEGAIRSIAVNRYERNSDARKKCIQHYGAICSVCDFEFKNKYGEIGAEYIHVHHIIPISSIRESYEVDPIEDLRPICPNFN